MARYYEETALIEFVKQYTPHINGENTMQCVERAIRNAPTADVVPKSEVVKVLDEIENTIRGALVLVGFSYKHNSKETQCKQECYEDFLGYIAQLKKKYTEGEDEKQS